MVRHAVLYILAGLPGTGKTTLAQLLAARIGAAHLRIDTIEQALRDLCSIEVEGQGYQLGYRVAGDILRSDLSVVADSCNPVALTRREWERVALDAAVACVNIEVVCSDTGEHRRRVEQRSATVPGLRLPTWRDVEMREYQEWTSGRIVVDTAGRAAAECLETLLEELSVLADARPSRDSEESEDGADGHQEHHEERGEEHQSDGEGEAHSV